MSYTTRKPTFSVLLPYYNELSCLARTVGSLLSQSRLPDQLIAVDNASTDGSQALCRRLLVDAPFEVTHVFAERPGKLFALAVGVECVRHEWVVHTDADVFYPEHYLARLDELVRRAPPGVNALMAIDVPDEPGAAERTIRDRLALHARFPTRCFTGGCGQTLRADDLRAIGGYSEQRWPYVLEDHEIMHRMHKRGRSLYDPALWCRPLDRRKDKTSVRWSWFERVLYRQHPDALGDAFFYCFLASRFRERNMVQLRLRTRDGAT